MGLQQAKKLLLFGDDLTAVQAHTLNLVAELAEDPLQRCKLLARQIAQRSDRSLSAIKRCVEIGAFPSSETILKAEVDAANWCFSHEDAMHAFSNFQRRKSPTSNISTEGGETLVSLLIKASSLHPQKVFLRFGEHDILFGQFANDVAVLAGGFLAVGLVAGDVVGAMMLNSEEMIKCWFATMWIGAVWAPMHASFSYSSRAY